MDFRKVAEALRAKLQETPPWTQPERAIGARETAFTVEREMAVQSLDYLYEHLVQFEQYKDAAALLAFCLPHLVADDPRVRSLVAKASRFAETMKDPETEKSAFADSLISRVPDEFLLNAAGCLQQRAWYWIMVARLVRAESALEFGCASGANVMHAAAIEPSIRWTGVDVSKTQIEKCREQAARVGSKASFFEHQGSYPSGDVVAVLDTIEHTVFPHELLDEAEMHVRTHEDGCCLPDSRGLVVVSCPNGSWSPHTANDKNLGAGQHVAVQRMATFLEILRQRGDVLDAQILPGFTGEGNSTLVATYRPGEKSTAGSTRFFATRMQLRGESTKDVVEGNGIIALPAALLPTATARSVEKPLSGKTIAIAYLQDSYWGSGLSADLLDDPKSPHAIAGGETYAMECSFGLAAAGANVDFYSSLIAPGDYKDVHFRKAADFLARPPDAILSLMNPFALRFAPPGCKTGMLQQVNHMNFGGVGGEGWKADVVVGASQHHVDYLKGLPGAPVGAKYTFVHNGCHVERYRNQRPVQDRDPIVAYWSSPDRGLHHLLNAWPLVRYPGAILRVHYEIERLLKITKERGERGERFAPGMEAIDRRMDELAEAVARAKADSTIQFTGMLSKQKMIEAQMETRVFCYPCDTVAMTEGYGSSVAEALAAGCLALVRPADALPSVYGRDPRWLESVEPRQLAAEIDRCILSASATPERDVQKYSWAESRKAFVKLMVETLG